MSLCRWTWFVRPGDALTIGEGLADMARTAVTPQIAFERELEALRESLLRMAGLVEAQIDDALAALRNMDPEDADKVQRSDGAINSLFRQIREEVLRVIATQNPIAADLRTVMTFPAIATELERIGDYAVRIGRRTALLAGLPQRRFRAELGLMGELASRQVRDILDALIEQDSEAARAIAARDDEVDRLGQRLIADAGAGAAEVDRRWSIDYR